MNGRKRSRPGTPGPAGSTSSWSRAQLVEIARLIDAGEIRPVLDAVLPLARACEAFERGLAGHVRGKIVLRVDDSEAFP